jgi:hypothetical protein
MKINPSWEQCLTNVFIAEYKVTTGNDTFMAHLLACAFEQRGSRSICYYIIISLKCLLEYGIFYRGGKEYAC